MLVNGNVASCQAAGAILRDAMYRICPGGCLHTRSRLDRPPWSDPCVDHPGLKWEELV